ncbi:NAD(P)-binding domain [Lasallia pustulata]|uniref:NAD(P)-binding domain n=1 Tax=Lasallia pustulata TaxID=136370 RepID=A0A1W5D6P0_9LECA|nr:NAD(P)-binding domain [Lasallia pustulata]
MAWAAMQAKHYYNMNHQPRFFQTVKTEDELQLMHNLVAEYSNFENIETHMSASSTAEGLNNKSDGRILTGATSALSNYLLSLLCDNPSVTQIICLIRAASLTAAHKHVNKSLLQHKKAHLQNPPLPNSLPPHPSPRPPPRPPPAAYSDLAT